MKRTLFSFILSGLCLCPVSGAEQFKGIFVSATNLQKTYLISEMPSIQYINVDNIPNAVLYLNETEVLRIALANGASLTVSYGEYTPDISTGINEALTDKESLSNGNIRKMITNGQLIIVDNNGHQYDTNGKLLK